MTLIDANIPLCAYNADAPQQPGIARRLTELFASHETIALTWPTIWAFVRISTNSRIRRNPLTAQESFTIVNSWRARPGVVVLQPGPRHLAILKQLVTDHMATGPLLTDAVLAAIAIENSAVLASTDQNFSRFKSLRWVNPLAQ